MLAFRSASTYKQAPSPKIPLFPFPLRTSYNDPISTYTLHQTLYQDTSFHNQNKSTQHHCTNHFSDSNNALSTNHKFIQTSKNQSPTPSLPTISQNVDRNQVRSRRQPR